MLWEHELILKCMHVSTAFLSSPKFSRVFLELNRNMENLFSISIRKHCEKKFSHSYISYVPTDGYM